MFDEYEQLKEKGKQAVNFESFLFFYPVSIKILYWFLAPMAQPNSNEVIRTTQVITFRENMIIHSIKMIILPVKNVV